MPKSEWYKVAVGVVVGAILTGGAFYVALPSRMSRLEGVVAGREGAPAARSAPVATATPITDTPQLSIKSPDSLIAIIADVQRAYVRESYGEYAGQNFSEIDFAKFQKDEVPRVIADSLRHDARFLGTVLGLKAADIGVQQTVLRNANRPLRRTWAEIGRISRDGQTDAGNRAERLIAERVVALARELVRLPANEIRKLGLR